MLLDWFTHLLSYASLTCTNINKLSPLIAKIFYFQSNSGTKAKEDLAAATGAVEVRSIDTCDSLVHDFSIYKC